MPTQHPPSLHALADRLRDGEDISFDNSEVSDPARLLDYAGRFGDLAGLADALRASAARLGEAYERLTPQELAREIPVRIWHEGQIMRDSPMPIGELIAVLADDPAAETDVPAWCMMKSQEYVTTTRLPRGWSFLIRRSY